MSRKVFHKNGIKEVKDEKKIIVVVKGLVFCEGKLLIVRRSAEELNGAGTWETPGGKIEFGESPENALHREILEEVGLTVKVDKLLYSFNMIRPKGQMVGLAFLCCSDSKEVQLSFEHDEYKWIDYNDRGKYLSPWIVKDMEKIYCHLPQSNL